MNENEFWYKTWKAVIVGIVSIIVSSVAFYNHRVKLYTENGYTKASLPGETYSQWVKIEEK